MELIQIKCSWCNRTSVPVLTKFGQTAIVLRCSCCKNICPTTLDNIVTQYNDMRRYLIKLQLDKVEQG
jgi:hypothetical protein